METIYILDGNFNTVKILDTIESVLWVERYSEYGDFELYAPVTYDHLLYFQIGYYLWRKDSDYMMIIESIQTSLDFENGNHMTVKGRSLESLLTRRIVWTQTILNGNLQDAIERLLNEAIISPSDEKRKIPNFIFERSTDEAITSLKVDTQFTGDNLYESVMLLCSYNDIGFKVRFRTTDNTFIFSLYKGKDRDYSQNALPHVVFSPNFDNLEASSFIEDAVGLRTVALVAGEGEGANRKSVTVFPYSEEYTGLHRRELFVDARDLSSEDGAISEKDYNKLLTSRGLEYLIDYVFNRTFEGSVNPFAMFRYGEDYFLGDKVQIQNEFGLNARVQITEVIRSYSLDGESLVPTFVIV